MLGQNAAQVGVPGSLPFCGKSEAFHDLRTYFIFIARNAYAAMHYDIERFTTHTAGQDFHTALEDAGGGAAPSGMEERDAAVAGSGEVDRDAVSDSDSEHQS